METEQSQCAAEDTPAATEFSIADMLDATNNQSHDIQIMRHYFVRMMKRKNHQEYLAELPNQVQKRILALKKLQVKTMEVEAAFHRQAFEIEKEFQKEHEDVFKKRLDIILGAYEPSDEEQYKTCENAENPDSTDISGKVSQINLNAVKTDDNIKGIPDFWLTVLKYVPKVEVMVKEHDEPILKYLADITTKTNTEPNMSFSLEFLFKPNEYFTNSILKKEYFMKCNPDPNDPFSFDGPEIYKSAATAIDWKDGKNVTVEKRIIDGEETEVNRASFFNFFSPPELPDDPNNLMFMTINAILEADFEVGHYLKDRVVPRAVLYFTGEAKDDPEFESSIGDSNLEMVFENPEEDKESKSDSESSDNCEQ